MEDDLYVEDIIVPLFVTPKNDPEKFRFLGTGFYVDNNGYLVTCKHVTDSVDQGEILYAYQLGIKQQLQLELIKNSPKYDLSLCKNIASPNLNEFWTFIDETYINLGSDIEVYGYVYEPLGPDEIPFRQRYFKGYITGISRDHNFSDSFELNFPALIGMSGLPFGVPP